MKATNQIELEQQNLNIVITKAVHEMNKASQSKTVSELKHSSSIIPFYVGELETKLRVYTASALTGKAKVKPVPAKALTLIDPMVVSHFTVKAVINIAGSKLGNSQSLYTSIAKQLETEYNLNNLKQKDAKVHSSFTSYLKQSGYTGYRLEKITTDLLAKYHSDIMNRNLTHVFIQVAQLAVHLLAECQPIIQGSIAPVLIYMSTVQVKEASKVVITPASWVMEWIKEQTLAGNMIANYHTALIEPPKDWTSLTNGGFYTERFKNPLIKTFVDYSKFNVDKLGRTMKAVNTIQKTEWEINTDVLSVMLYAFENKLSWGELPVPVKVEDTPYPYPDRKRDTMTAEELKNVKNWAAHVASLHCNFHSDMSRYLALSRTLNEAKRFSQYEKIYFAYQTDFRGRIYPIAANLHPQGPSVVKSLLRFHQGKPIDSESARQYLALQGANTFGNDKIRLEEKLEWVLANQANILASANDPISTDFWKGADEPWSFLAFCFEWRDYQTSPKTFLSKLPIALDGSCNGLQHLSAMLRDEVGGAEVNLTANVQKKDIYSAVKDIAIQVLAGSGEPLAKKILEFGIERSTCKRPVMIMPYAGTQSSCREYVRQDFEERGGKAFFGEDLPAAISLTSSTIWSSIGLVVIKGREIMSWFKKTARKAAKASDDCTINWETPNGFQVFQKRTQDKDILYQTSLGDKINVRLSIRLKEETDVTDLSGHSTAVCPNFIHSLDACALQETVLLGAEAGIGSFAMIHDSYGTHAADSHLLAVKLRQAFVTMYKENDVLAQWIAKQPAKAAKDFPPLPELGNLNLDEILNSEHFFA